MSHRTARPTKGGAAPSGVEARGGSASRPRATSMPTASDTEAGTSVPLARGTSVPSLGTEPSPVTDAERAAVGVGALVAAFEEEEEDWGDKVKSKKGAYHPPSKREAGPRGKKF